MDTIVSIASIDSTLQVPPRCTFDVEDWKLMAQYWYPIALASDVSAQPISAMLLDEPLVLYKVGEATVVARDVCPHRGVPLSLGAPDGAGGIRCRYHGLRFGAGGQCNHIPANPGRPIPKKLNLRTYPAVERYGLIWTCLARANQTVDGAAMHAELPAMPYWDHEGFQQIVCPIFDVAGFAGRQLEGFIDVAHFGWVHTSTFGDPNDTEVPEYTTTETPTGFNADYRSFIGNYPIGSSQQGQAGFEWLRHFEVHLPFSATLTVHFPNDGKLVIMNAACPVSARQTRLFAPIARNFDLDIPVEAVHEFNLKVFEEDRLVVETQKPEWLPLDPSAEGHILADRSSLAYRKGLRKLGFSAFFSA